MIISASRRTDVPAFHADWFMQRVREGEVLVPNPVRPAQVSRIALALQSVDAFVFWTKDPSAMLPHLGELDAMGYQYYFLYTLNPYDAELEPGVPPFESRIDTFIRLAGAIGPERVIWRYDPVIITPRHTPGWHRTAYHHLASLLFGHTRKSIVSFLDDYAKIRMRMRTTGYILPPEGVMTDLATAFASSAGSFGMDLAFCSEALDLAGLGIMPAGCINAGLVERLAGRPLATIRKDPGQRAACTCVLSRDIGTYGTCGHGCRYCYAC